ncbi:MAG: hypothetical protein WDN27_02220 [Candidatus Saccharibacteria bacterium]
MASTATARTQVSDKNQTPGQEHALKTFVRYFDDDGDHIGDYSLGIGELELSVAVRLMYQDLREHPETGAYHYQIFTALANRRGRPKIVKDTMDALHPRPLRVRVRK